jgi:hypothetical protein
MYMNTASSIRFFYDRAYLWLLLAPIITFLGFFPSYFGKMGSADLGHHIHGATATLWMMLLVSQPFFYARNKMTIHRLMGKFSMVLVPVLIVTGIVMIHKMMTGGVYPPQLAYQLGFIDFYVLTQFAVFYILAIKNVNNTEYHARWMVSTVFGPLIPALTRLLFWMFAVQGFTSALNISFGLVELALLIMIVGERRRGIKNHVYPTVFVVTGILHLLMNFAADWVWWQSFMNWIGRF